MANPESSLPGVNVAGFLRGGLGLGEAGRLYVAALRAAGREKKEGPALYAHASTEAAEHPDVDRGERSHEGTGDGWELRSTFALWTDGDAHRSGSLPRKSRVYPTGSFGVSGSGAVPSR